MRGLLAQVAAETATKKFWILDPLYQALGVVIAFFYDIVPDYGFAIVLLTVAVRVVLIPLTAKQVKSMMAMQRLQPEIKRLQQKYKNDRQKLNEEMMKFYKENQVSPFSSCLPLLLQMPLFIVLYRLIYDLVPKVNGKVAPPKHIPKTSALFKSLIGPDGNPVGTMKAWGMDMAEKATSAGAFAKAWPYYVLIAVVVATGYYQQKQTTAMTAGAGDSAASQQAQMMGKIFPVFFGFISLNIPAGVVVYFAVSNLWQIGQQAILFRRLGTTTPLPKAAEPKAEGSSKGLTKGGSKPTPRPAPKPDPKGSSKGGRKLTDDGKRGRQKPGPRAPGGTKNRGGSGPAGAGGGNGSRSTRSGGKPKRGK